MSKRWVTLFLIFCSFSVVRAQQNVVDSLKLELSQQGDTARFRLLLQISNAYLSFSARKAAEPAGEARSIARQSGDKYREGLALYQLGLVNSRMGKTNDALLSFDQAESIMKEKVDKLRFANFLIDVGNACVDASLYEAGLTKALAAQKIFQETNDKSGVARSLIISGNVYRQLGDTTRARLEYEKALELSREARDAKTEGSCLNNLSIVYGNLGKQEKSLQYLSMARDIYDRIGEKYSLGKVINNMASEYFDMGDYTKATELYLEALEIRRSIGDKRGQAMTLSNLGSVHVAQELNEKGVEYFTRALALAVEIEATSLQMAIYQQLSEAYVRMGDTDKAIDVFRKYSTLKDSIFNKDLTASIAEMQAKFDVDKAQSEVEAQMKQKKLVILSSVLGGLLLLIIVFIFWRQAVVRKKTNVRLNQQNKVIEAKNTELNQAYKEIELKNKDITDSIRYARRIQEAILPEEEFRMTFGRDGFVLYKPKDIVSGDFYWMARKGKYLLFAAVDCTGHGVPGAFVSIVCSNLLSQAVNEHSLLYPADILNDVNARLSVTLRQRADESKVRDGMDIALCLVDTEESKLHFAGAFNPAVIIRGLTHFELKGDKFPVGNFEDEELRIFCGQTFDLQENDRIYLFTDGYSDQFGGPQGKKYKRTRFTDFLVSIQQHDFSDHGELLNREHLAWKGENEQIDDILVMGIRFSRENFKLL